MMMLTLTTFQMVALQGLPKYSILATKIIDFASGLGEYVILFTNEIFRGVEMSMILTIIHIRLFMMMVVMMVTIIFMDMRMMVIIIMYMPMIMLLSSILPGQFFG